MSSFYDLASLVMIPSGKKVGKVYSQKPLTTDGQLDFTRASTATRIGSDGKIEKTRTNLLLQSNTFNTTWTNSNSSETSGQSGYDGTNNAWLLESTGSSGSLRQSVSSSGVISYSIYVKAGTVSYVRLRIDAATEVNAWFHLSGSGSAGTLTNGISSLIESVGNNWYRVSVIANASSLTTIRIYPSPTDAGGNTTGDNIYIQDAQLEPGLVATNVITTTSAAVSVGSVDNMPRLNYTEGSSTSCPSLLLEPQRTNLYLQSEYLNVFSGTATINSSVSPEGLTNATKMTKTSSSDQFVTLSWSGSSLSASTNYALSLFVKYSGHDIDLKYETNNFNDWGKSWNALFTVRSSGVTASTTNLCTSSVKNYGNSWYQILVFVETASSITPTSPSNLIRVIGESSTEALLYGAQMEAGSYATSYIPTFGATVTRVADACSKTGVSGLIGQTEGTLLAEFKIPTGYSGSDNHRFSISDNTNSNWVFVSISSGNDSRIFYRTSGTNLIDYIPADNLFTPGNTYKIAFAYKNGDSAYYVNGVQKQLFNTALSAPSSSFNFYTISGATFTQSSLQTMSNNIKKALLFKTRLSNTQLAELTSIDS